MTPHHGTHRSRSHSNICSAAFSEIPGIAAISLASVFLNRATLPNFSNKTAFRFGDIPGQSSNKLSFIRRR